MSSRQPERKADAARTGAEDRRSAPVLPERSDMESPGAWGEGDDGAMSDDEWLREVPPHHG